MPPKTRVAVLFGGPSSEHDVSICTGLEVLQALDPAVYDTLPVYIGLDGQWWTGDPLRRLDAYLPDAALKRQLTRVSLDVGHAREGGLPVLRAVGGGGIFGARRTYPFDVAIPALHGTWGEDGTLQGVMAAEAIPLAGCNTAVMALTINKLWTLEIAKALGVPTLPTLLLWRGEATDGPAVAAFLGTTPAKMWPLFVKPNFLGSSIGARVVRSEVELQAALAEVFRLDTAALVQPCVPHLVEYNISVRRNRAGEVETSAIERPQRQGDLLSFTDKYAGSGSNKLTGRPAPGMAAMDRTLNPPELGARDAQIRAWAKAMFSALDMAGAPRLDFLGDAETGALWFNEVNPLPGGFAYFLWAAAKPAVPFCALLDDMLAEAHARLRSRARVVDPVATGGGIFRQRG